MAKGADGIDGVSGYTDGSVTQMARPHLHVHHVDLFVSDQDRSLRFMVDQLGFTVVVDADTEESGRFIAVSPPDGQTLIGLVAERPGRPVADLIGRSSVVFITDDLETTYDEWRARGVCFTHPPRRTTWGGLVTGCADPDGNVLTLMSHDNISRELEAQRRQVAQHEEAKRQALREIQIAKEFQARLLPQAAPSFADIDCAGLCLQARQVGGDYYDFLTLGADGLGLVIGDISGKGIGAALLMANLQATLRSQSTAAPDDPKRVLKLVNAHLFGNTTASAYATLFFGKYRSDGRLRYVNCGHPPALVVRADSSIEELPSTSTVLGLFDEWECRMDATTIRPGDTLILYTDGVTECLDAAGREFGLERLASIVTRTPATARAQAILDAIVQELRTFTGDETGDDVTLIVAKRQAGGREHGRD